MGKLLLAETVEDIALILGLVQRLIQQIPAAFRIPANPGIMAGGDAVAAQDFRPAEKEVEFQMPVAFDAGVGGQPLRLAADNLGDDLLFKSVLGVHDVEGHPQPSGHAPGILRIL